MVRLSNKGRTIHNTWQPLQSLSLYPHNPDILLPAFVMQMPDHFFGRVRMACFALWRKEWDSIAPRLPNNRRGVP